MLDLTASDVQQLEKVLTSNPTMTWDEAVEDLQWEAEQARREQEELERHCPTCHGSGGGEGYWACTSCGGSGNRRRRRDYYED